MKKWNKQFNLVIVTVILYVIVMFLIVLTKYTNFQYNALDLGIFTDVMKETLNGNLLNSTIQGHNYFGDHFTPIIFLLMPVFWLFKSSLTLLIVQIIVIALGACPLYLISTEIIKEEKWKRLIVVLYLLNPSIWMMNLFEFHLLPMVLPIVFFLYYFYLKDKWLQFIIFLFLALMVREDVALLLIPFGVMFWLQKQKKYAYVTIISSVVWLMGSLVLISYFDQQTAKFLGYFSLEKLMNLGQIELVLGLLLPLAFFPLIKWRYLLLGVLVYFEYAMLGGLGAIVIRGHYATLFLIPIFLSIIFVFKDFENKKIKMLNWLGVGFPLILALATIYTWYFMGPIQELNKIERPLEEKQVIREMIEQVRGGKNVLTSYTFAPYLAANNNVYSLHYFMLGSQQYSEKKYLTPSEFDFVVIHESDLAEYVLQYQNHSFYGQNYLGGWERLNNILDEYGVVNLGEGNYLLARSGDKQITARDAQFEGYITLNRVGMTESVVYGEFERIISLEE